MNETQTKTNNIVEVARENGNFKTFLSAITSANLTERFAGDSGPYTVLMPNDAAFAKLPAGNWDKYIGDVPKLTEILNYHVLRGNFPSAEIAKMTEARTVEGRPVKIDAKMDLRINDAKVVQRDMKAENGVIHVIDTVLLPR
jgi:uncharacterized surface protein with fasciclin (FAS1) repeats